MSEQYSSEEEEEQKEPQKKLKKESSREEKPKPAKTKPEPQPKIKKSEFPEPSPEKPLQNIQKIGAQRAIEGPEPEFNLDLDDKDDKVQVHLNMLKVIESTKEGPWFTQKANVKDA